MVTISFSLLFDVLDKSDLGSIVVYSKIITYHGVFGQPTFSRSLPLRHQALSKQIVCPSCSVLHYLHLTKCQA